MFCVNGARAPMYEVRIAIMHRVKGLEFNYIFKVGVNNKALTNGVRSDFSDDVSLEEFET